MQKELLYAYFEKILFTEAPAPALSVLETLQQKHLETFAFENLNPLLCIPVRLDFESLYHKLVSDHRGGYCYEQNLLFLHVLKAIGFKARGLSARVIRPDGLVLGRTHMLLLVEMEGVSYLSDVGFGSMAAPQPLQLIPGLQQMTCLGPYKISQEPAGIHTLEVYTQGNWRPLYAFELQEQLMADFEIGNWWTSAHPNSVFVKNLMVSRLENDGRYTLMNNLFSTYHSHKPDEKKRLSTPREIREVLTQYFKLTLHNLPGLDEKLMQLLQREKASA